MSCHDVVDRESSPEDRIAAAQFSDYPRRRDRSAPAGGKLPDNSPELIAWLNSDAGTSWTRQTFSRVHQHALVEDYDDLPEGHDFGGTSVTRSTHPASGSYTVCDCMREEDGIPGRLSRLLQSGTASYQQEYRAVNPGTGTTAVYHVVYGWDSGTWYRDRAISHAWRDTTFPNDGRDIVF